MLKSPKKTRVSLKALRAGLLSDTRGLSTVEYVIILVLIAVIAITAWKNFGQAVQSRVTQATDQFNTHVQVTPGH